MRRSWDETRSTNSGWRTLDLSRLLTHWVSVSAASGSTQHRGHSVPSLQSTHWQGSQSTRRTDDQGKKLSTPRPQPSRAAVLVAQVVDLMPLLRGVAGLLLLAELGPVQHDGDTCVSHMSAPRRRQYAFSHSGASAGSSGMGVNG